MRPQTHLSAMDEGYERLPWDSQHFGYPVARLSTAMLDDEALERALEKARADRIGLVYWMAPGGRIVADRLLREFHGALVDRKTTYAAELVELRQRQNHRRVASVKVVELPVGMPDESLERLGIAAGEFSRFRADSRIPHERADSLYLTWTQRSAMRELADMVLVARPEAAPAAAAGFITLSESNRQASIGLIAVDATFRGQGIGQLLMEAAHLWMDERRALRVTVVTQGTNTAACQFYEKCGYHPVDVTFCYHFWPCP